MRRKLLAPLAFLLACFLAVFGVTVSAAIVTVMLPGTITVIGPGTPIGLSVNDPFMVEVTYDDAVYLPGFSATLMPGDPGYSILLTLPTIGYSADTDDDVEFGLAPDVPSTTFVGGAVADFDFAIVNDYNAGAPVGAPPLGDPLLLNSPTLGLGDIVVALGSLAIHDVIIGPDPEEGGEIGPIPGALIASGEFDTPLAAIPLPPAIYFLGSALAILFARGCRRSTSAEKA